MTHPAAAPQTKPTIVRAGEGTVVDAFGSRIRFVLAREETDGRMTLGIAEVPPGDGPPPHVHQGEDEMFIIVEGRYGIFAGGEWTEVGPGTVVYLPRGSVHTFRNVGEGMARHWVLTTPCGFEEFYARCQAEFAASGGPDMTRILEISAEHGIEFA